MAQYGIPISDLSHTGWTEGAGGGDGNHFDEVDDGINNGGTPDDATTYWVHASGTGASGELISNVTALTDPVSSSGHVARSRQRKSATGGKTLDVGIAVDQGGGGLLLYETVAAAFDTTTWTTHASTLSGGQADAITNYADLEVKTRATWSGGGAARSMHVTAQELEVPNAPGGGGRTTKNTRAFPLGTEIGMNWRGAA